MEDGEDFWQNDPEYLWLVATTLFDTIEVNPEIMA
jgi:hypothetical protein